MADKKLSTEEILAKLRQQDSSGAAAGEPSAAQAPAQEEVSASAPAAEAPKPAAAKPSSTADILAAARAGSGGAAKAKPAGGKPSSTADILAAARAGGGGASAGTSAKPTSAAKPAVAAKKAAVPAAGERPSVAEMVKAAREGKPLGDAAAAPVKPKLPSKPPLPTKKPAEDPNRRSFLATAIITLCTPYYLAWGALATIGGIWTLATARFMMPNMIVEPPTKFKIGPPSDYPPGTVSTKWKAERGIWVVNTDYDGRNLVYALASVCTHLGCTPNWLEGEQKFKCPCHGSGFYINGINFEGPAPRPLERVGLRLAEDGALEVDKSVKFQEELGQWQDPSSFVELS